MLGDYLEQREHPTWAAVHILEVFLNVRRDMLQDVQEADGQWRAEGFRDILGGEVRYSAAFRASVGKLPLKSEV